jgi:hypothetical protein
VIEYATGTPDGPFDTVPVASACDFDASDPLVSLGPDGQVHLAWINTGESFGLVRHATLENGAWRNSIVAKVDRRSRAFAQSLDLTVDQRNRPHLVYFAATISTPGKGKPKVVYATRGRGGWSKQSMGALTFYPSIAVGPDGSVHVVFSRPLTKRGVYHAERRGATWRRELVEAVAGDTATDVFVDEGGTVHVAFLDGAAGILKYARRAGR